MRAGSPEAPWRGALREWIGAEAKPVDKYGHQPRLYALTELVGRGSAYDDDVVFAAAWLHDLGVFLWHRPEDPLELARWDNSAYAMRECPGILVRLGFPVEKIPAVVECIRTHQPAGDPRTLEATILRDADILEQLGAVGILRAVCKVGRDTRYSHFTDVVAVLKNALGTLPGKLRLEPSKELASRRIEILEGFLDAVAREAAELLY